MPELYRNAWYAQLKKKVDELQEEIEKAIELPSVTSADEGKVLTVDNDGKWDAEDVPKELPIVTSAEQGQVLIVDESGDWVPGELHKELPVVQTTDAGKVLTVDSNGEWGAEISYPVNYSTDERLIGTWVNGQPLYQKTIGYTSNGGDSDTDIVIDTSIRQGDNAFVVDMCGVEGYGYLINDELRMNGTTAPEPIGQYYIHLPFFGGGTAKSPYIYCGGDGVHFLKNGDEQAAKSIVITLRYIK